jgi:hypothetical protein
MQLQRPKCGAESFQSHDRKKLPKIKSQSIRSEFVSFSAAC